MIKCIQKQYGYSKNFMNRDYFMYIDHKGQLFLEETEPKNYVTCIKDPKFFLYFYRNLTKNITTRHRESYKYVSKCWGEFNFVKCYITPIVFNDIAQENSSWKILAQNGYSEDFDPKQVYLKDGVLYHKCKLNDLGEGIFSSDLSVKLGDHLKNETTLLWEDAEYNLLKI